MGPQQACCLYLWVTQWSACHLKLTQIGYSLPVLSCPGSQILEFEMP